MGKHVIVLGGRLGAGSETILGMLARLGYVTVDADDLAQRFTRKGMSGYRQIIDRIGDRFLDAKGELDLTSIYQAARVDRRLVPNIRAIVNPSVQRMLIDIIQQANGQPVFIKSNNAAAYGLPDLIDQTWIVTASEEAETANLVRERHLAPALALQFVRARARPNLQATGADVILHNSAGHASLWDQLIEALRGIGAGLPMEEYELSAKLPECRPEDAGSTPAPSRVAFRTGEPHRTDREPVLFQGSLPMQQLMQLGGQLSGVLLVPLALAFFTSWGLMLAEYGRQHLRILPWQAAWQALLRTAQYVSSHPQTYYWGRLQVPWLELVSTALGHSAGLLVISMGAALILGLPLGFAAATAQRKGLSAIVMVASVLGASTPSFLFAMMLWIVNIWVHRSFNVRVLPATGFGWDVHLILPALVLAMRPMAQIAQVTYVSISEAIQQDYVRTAYSKGLAWHTVRDRHVLRNTLIPVLNTLGTSLRFSLASLPVVEIFFHWPGVGSMLLDAINLGTAPLVMDLIVSLGLFFVLFNLLIEFSFPLIDPRVRTEPAGAAKTDAPTLKESLRDVWSIVTDWDRPVRQIFRHRSHDRAMLKRGREQASSKKDPLRAKRSKWILRSLLRNPILIASSIVVLLLIGLTLFGANFTRISPYQVHGVMAIDGAYGAPPFKPSSVFQWGTDQIGRDVQSLVLAGAQKTLSLAFFGMLARLLLGTTLGILAGWRRNGRFDRLVTGAMSMWAAFPATLFAMIVIQALGIQQGMWVFVAAICLVGWGEAAQFVRGQVISLKPRLFIESARAAGARVDQILLRHVLPNLANQIIVLAALEMGGVLMLLAELGFLNVFMGGGFRAMLGETGSMKPILAYYSDVPEWGALIANVREQWRSYPWMALYPGLAVMISIITFNLFGEGLRRFLDDSALSLSRLFNRYTFMLGAGLTIIVVLVLQSSVPLSVYRAEGLKFDERPVLKDIQILSSTQIGGRETGSPGASMAALYIAQRLAQIGIFPAGERYGYFQRSVRPRLHLMAPPTLAVTNGAGGLITEFTYKRDFVDLSRINQSRGDADGSVIGVAYGPVLDSTSAGQSDLRDSPAFEHVIIVRAGDLPKVKARQTKGILVIADESSQLERRDVYPYDAASSEDVRPYLLISPELADLLLRTTGSSLVELDNARSTLAPGTIKLTEVGAPVRMSVPAREPENVGDEAYINVIGVIPGQGHFMGTEEQVIVVSAYYDGLGTDPTGVVYPGANDNASGVGTMLELARLLKQSAYQPDKTVLFVAWAGGERQEGLSVVDILNARPGASDMTVETVMELSGVGYGTGKAISIGSESSYRLVQLFQDAASRYRVPTTTSGRGPHYDLPATSIFGGRDAMTLSISWDGSDTLAHTARDIPATIDPAKLRQTGRSTYLTLLVLCRESEY